MANYTPKKKFQNMSGNNITRESKKLRKTLKDRKKNLLLRIRNNYKTFLKDN